MLCEVKIEHNPLRIAQISGEYGLNKRAFSDLCVAVNMDTTVALELLTGECVAWACDVKWWWVGQSPL